eukprot:gene28006-34798_t
MTENMPDCRNSQKFETDIASLTGTSHALGVLGFLLDEATYLQIPAAEGKAFVPHVAPEGKCPEAADTIARVDWKDSQKLFNTQANEVLLFKKELKATIPKGKTLSIVKGQKFGLVGISLKEMFACMKKDFGTMRHSDLQENEDKLKVPYLEGGSIADFMDAHVLGHEVASDNNVAYTEFAKVSTAIKALTPCDLFKRAIEQFFEENETPALQTFAKLDKIVRSAGSRRAKTATSNTEKYSASEAKESSTAKLTSRDQAIYDRGYADGMAAAATFSKNKTPPANINKKDVDLSDRPYCHTHGPCRHTGSECTTAKEGHRAEATWGNKLGGPSVYTQWPEKHKKR